jgi:hypothetical protein
MTNSCPVADARLEHPTNTGLERRSADVKDRACWDQFRHVEAFLTVDANTYADLLKLPIVGGFVFLAGLFVLTEVASGVLKEVEKEL